MDDVSIGYYQGDSISAFDWSLEMAALDDSLDDWTAIESDIPSDDRGLLIGNGASIAVWRQFHYASLLEMASDFNRPEHLSTRERRIFDDMETTNFEAVLSALIVAGRMWKHFEKPDKDIQDLRDAYSVIRKKLDLPPGMKPDVTLVLRHLQERKSSRA
jgi:hypothetical protein